MKKYSKRFKVFVSNKHIAKVIAHGKVLKIFNIGENCTGFWNTGHKNAGNENTGNMNIGNKNTGDCNTGDKNTGDCNPGDKNTGNSNTGNKNTGNYNIGDKNTGDWNISSCNTGCFMTEEQKISMFNQSSNWTYQEWLCSDARHLLNQISKSVVEWIYTEDMTEEEKTEHPTHKTTGGYLKILDESECGQIWWDSLTDRQKGIIRAIPNYDKEIFEQITGIKTDI